MILRDRDRTVDQRGLLWFSISLFHHHITQSERIVLKNLTMLSFLQNFMACYTLRHVTLSLFSEKSLFSCLFLFFVNIWERTSYFRDLWTTPFPPPPLPPNVEFKTKLPGRRRQEGKRRGPWKFLSRVLLSLSSSVHLPLFAPAT